MGEDPAAFDLDNPKLPKSIQKAALASGGFPYEEKLDSEVYAEELLSAHQQLALFQEHMAKNGDRVIIVFEGRDAAGKGGAIKTYLANLNPRFNISAALPKPNDRERTQWYFQRYIDWLPAAGEQVLFDRSWYNRAGVEPVMGFCTPEQTAQFLREVPQFEHQLVGDGIHLFKFWLTIGKEMQLKRFHDRKHDVLKRWKLSPIDLEALPRFDAYTQARNAMLEMTSTKVAPWTVILGNDKRRARVNIIRSVLHKLAYEGKDEKAIGEIDSKIVLHAEDFLERHRDA
jgi:polyphosphate kinase 2